MSKWLGLSLLAWICAFYVAMNLYFENEDE